MTHSLLRHGLALAATLALAACGTSPTAPTVLPPVADTGLTPLRPVVLSGSVYLYDANTNTVASSPSGTLRVEAQPTALLGQVAVTLRLTRPSGVIEVSGPGIGGTRPNNSQVTFTHPGSGPECALFSDVPPAPGAGVRDGQFSINLRTAPPDPTWGGELLLMTCVPGNSARTMLYGVTLTPQ
jgi:hypothetical protein